MWLVTWLAVAWVITYLADGTRTPAPHLFYVPVIVAAVRVGPIHTLAVSVAAGLACGPLMPLDVAGGAAQPVPNWLVRLAFFVLIGQLTAVLMRHTVTSGSSTNRSSTCAPGPSWMGRHSRAGSIPVGARCHPMSSCVMLKRPDVSM